MASIRSVLRISQYLEEQIFAICSNHALLKWIITHASRSDQINHWRLYILQIAFEIVCYNGLKHQATNALLALHSIINDTKRLINDLFSLVTEAREDASKTQLPERRSQLPINSKGTIPFAIKAPTNTRGKTTQIRNAIALIQAFNVQLRNDDVKHEQLFNVFSHIKKYSFNGTCSEFNVRKQRINIGHS